MSALLEVAGLRVRFNAAAEAVRGVSIRVDRGETHCLVGESGCGKSVSALAVMGLLARGATRSADRLEFAGQDLRNLSERGMARLRGDTFCCLLTDLAQDHDAHLVISRLLESFATSFEVDGHELFITAKVGISVYPVDGTDPEDLAQLAQDNFKPLFDLQPLSDQRGQLQSLQQWTQTEGARLAPLMAARRAAGCVREGHGDLHLGNLLWLDGRARLFDAIEFPPALRWIGTAGDIAFLFMDLHAHGLAPLAWRFLNAWLEHTGDLGAVARLPWDAVYRALVRAKVAALRVAQCQHAADRAAALAQAQRYVRLAARLAAPRRPWLALTLGVSGSGKSSQSQALIEQRGLVRLRADVERKRLFGLAPEASSAAVPGGIYGEDVSERVFAHLLDATRALLQAGQPVLVDATFIRRARREPFVALAESLGLPWRILAFDAPEAVLRERVRRRHASGGDASEADEAVLLRQLAQREPLAADEAAHALRIDTGAPVDWAHWDAALPPAD